VQQFTVKQLASLAGVSVRTLHLYDQIDLLKPSVRTDKQYRLYGKAELLRLQQILFYKELDLPLKEIAAILDDPDFDPLTALQQHKTALLQKQQRIKQLLVTIDKTIDQLKNEDMLQPEELYEGLSKEKADSYRQAAKEEWGAAFERSEKHLMKKTKSEFKELGQAAALNRSRLLVLQDQDPASEAEQKEIAIHYHIIREFWGTAGSPDHQAEAYAGLGDLYVADERYTMIDGQPQPAFALFMQKAMRHFAKKLG
jgi:DNA-binding transcriptional MerR regulator